MKNTPFDLTGKVAVITGSSRGIGRSSAELLAKLGAKVVISSRKADACEEVADGIKKAGGDAHVIPCNISRREEVEALISGTTKHYGKVDILVCNAAVNPVLRPAARHQGRGLRQDHGLQRQEQHLALRAGDPANGRARQRLGRDRLLDRRPARLDRDRRLRHLQGGGFRAVPQPRRRMGPERRARQLRRAGPGQDRFRPRVVGRRGAPEAPLATTPLRRIGEPDEIAGAVAYLASDASTFMTGQTIVVDGGVTTASV